MASWSDLAELKQYFIAKPSGTRINSDSLINRFIDKYYGDPTPFITEYFELSHTTLKAVADTVNLDIYGLPSYYFRSFLTRDLVNQYHRPYEQG